MWEGLGDWCLLAEDSKSCICARISKGSVKKCGEAGWLHILDETYEVKQVKKKRPVPINWNLLNEFYKKKRCPNQIAYYGDKHNIHCSILLTFDIGYDGKATTFPMRNEKKEIIGIHKRYTNGDKRIEKGSQLGLFIPNTLDLLIAGRIYVCEGLTDTAAVYNLGYKVIGKPNARAGNELVCKFVEREYIKEVIIIADNDNAKSYYAGQEGAKDLSLRLSELSYSLDIIRIIVADTKDIREDIKQYGKEAVIERLNL